ncbi:DNA circularization protein [Halomonas saccharevitans]|uniref:Mu-like prophage DNA circulation protein n=1 Tax=Halomonas saccharevitans TaxID=416872 RepID=A0A1I7AFP5_9GAMM|nr:DNA circularization N-terminal domain-containing protein [Halomonas saccharevitans]SFT73738.1 Mu-like prophage DNA circulation protein [Halomonas saccharevitans]
MSWRDRIDPELAGEFRGVRFHVERSDTTGGRRWLIHEYPRRDRPHAEDMGRKAREWRLQMFVAGDDYDRQRDALIEALDAPGAATLVHPYLGSVTAVASDVSWRESTREGGVCTFQVTFSEAGQEAYPATSIDTQREVRQASDAFETALADDFAERWSVEGLLGWSLVAVQRDLDQVVRGLEDVVGGVAEQVADQLRAPAAIAATVLGGYDRLRQAVLKPAQALDLYGGAGVGAGDAGAGRVLLTPGTPTRAARLLRETGTGSDSVTPPVADTPARRQRAQNTMAARQLNGRAATLAASRLVGETAWTSREEALAAGEDALALIDAQMATQAPITDAVYATLVTLRAKVSEDLRARAVALPGLTTYTPQATMPALVVAHRLYGDATRADEVAARNRARHPGALRGGMTLEVLSE